MPPLKDFSLWDSSISITRGRTARPQRGFLVKRDRPPPSRPDGADGPASALDRSTKRPRQLSSPGSGLSSPRDSSAPAKGPDGDLFYAPRALAPFGERALGSALTGAIPYRIPRAISIMLVRASSRSAEEMDCFSPFRVSEMVSRVAALLPLRAAL